ncbi:Thioredoxin-like fold, partial [Amanita muscaria]
INSGKPILIDFWAAWCGPCRFCKVILPLFTEISDKAPKNFKYYKIDVKKHLDVAKEFNIELTPTFILFKDGKKLDDSIGASPHVLEVSRF